MLNNMLNHHTPSPNSTEQEHLLKDTSTTYGTTSSSRSRSSQAETTDEPTNSNLTSTSQLRPGQSSINEQVSESIRNEARSSQAASRPSDSKPINEVPLARQYDENKTSWCFDQKAEELEWRNGEHKGVYHKLSKKRVSAITKSIEDVEQNNSKNIHTFAVRIKGEWASVGLVTKPKGNFQMLLGTPKSCMIFQPNGKIYFEEKKICLERPENPKFKSGSVVVVELYKDKKAVQFYANGIPFGYKELKFSVAEIQNLCFAVELLYSIESAEIVD